MVKLSDYVAQFIASLGVKHVFLVPGGGSMHLVDSVSRNKSLNYICNLHEQACAIAADAYGQYTQNIGVALVTTGPGGTNTLTGVAASWLDSTPVLIVSGQVKRADMVGARGVRQMGFQEINIVEIVRPITKYSATVAVPEEIRYHLEKAAFIARSGRPGPVWIDIPLDVQAITVDEGQLRGYDESSERQLPIVDEVSRTIDLLNKSERPVILVGNGVRLGGAISEFLELSELLQIPILTTWKAIDFFAEDHPLFVGRPGIVGQRGANFTQQNSDLFISLGARLDIGQIGYDHRLFARGAKKVLVDIDRHELAKMEIPIDISICVDTKIFIQEFLRQKDKLRNVNRQKWIGRCKDWQTRYPVVLPEYWEGKKVNNYVLVDVLSDEMSEEDLLIPGSSGACCEVTMQALRVKRGTRIYYTPGLGSMGFGISASIGGCIASGGRRTICIDGDGGFFMNMQELEVVKRLNLPIKFFILNNQGYASIRSTQKNYFKGHFVASDISSGLTLPDTEKVAKTFDIRFHRIENHQNIHQDVRCVLDQTGPVLCEVMMDFEHTTAPKMSSYQRKDGSFVSKPLEDLAPFLDRKEFKENMLVPVIEDE